MSLKWNFLLSFLSIIINAFFNPIYFTKCVQQISFFLENTLFYLSIKTGVMFDRNNWAWHFHQHEMVSQELKAPICIHLSKCFQVTLMQFDTMNECWKPDLYFLTTQLLHKLIAHWKWERICKCVFNRLQRKNYKFYLMLQKLCSLECVQSYFLN